MYNSLTISELMERILDFTSAVDPELRNSLGNGLSSEQIEEYTQVLSFKIPVEVEELYKWHNGMDYEDKQRGHHPILYYHYFLSITEAIDGHLSWIDDETSEGLGLFPIFRHQNEFYATSCSPSKQSSLPIYFVSEDNLKAYDSLRTMLLSILECYETGVYQIGSDRWDLEIDEERAAEIKLRWNPCRNTELALFDHP